MQGTAHSGDQHTVKLTIEQTQREFLQINSNFLVRPAR
jgi:hypothetical protein